MRAHPARIYGRAGFRRRRRRRRQLLLVAALLASALALWLVTNGEGKRDAGTSGGAAVQRAQMVRITSQGGPVLEGRADDVARATRPQLSDWLNRVPERRRARRGRASVILETDRDALELAVRKAARAGGGAVVVPERRAGAYTRLPVVKQALRNNCETAALSMLLAGSGLRVDQLELQRQVPRSGPLDPVANANGGPPIWGNPQRGYVGRPAGGGTSGGYGVYERPIRALARRRGVVLDDLTRSSPRAIYRRLLTGHPVMAWIGLSAGPYRTWRTPTGGRVIGNFGEHTVVLTGLRGDTIELNDPLVGERTTWTKRDFERMWRRLDRRALSV